MRDETLAVSLARHDLESALNSLEKCDIRVPTLGEACNHIRKALELVDEDLELRRRHGRERGRGDRLPPYLQGGE